MKGQACRERNVRCTEITMEMEGEPKGRLGELGGRSGGLETDCAVCESWTKP